MSAIVPVVVAVVLALALILVSRKHVSARVVVRTRVDSPQRVEQLLDSPQVQQQLRAAGIDPAALATNIHEGRATFEGGKLHVTKTVTSGSVNLDRNAPLPPGAHALTQQEASAFTDSPEFLEALRAKGIDPEQFKRDVAAGKIMGTFETHSTGTQSPAPQSEKLAPPSDDGDDVWKTGKL
jgi:hypothetical protein